MEENKNNNGEFNNNLGGTPEQNSGSNNSLLKSAGYEAGNNIKARAENRLKKAMKEFGKATKAMLAPIKKYILIFLVAIMAAIAIFILIAGIVYYLLDLFSIPDPENKSSVPGQIQVEMQAVAVENPETGEITFTYTDLNADSSNPQTVTAIEEGDYVVYTEDANSAYIANKEELKKMIDAYYTNTDSQSNKNLTGALDAFIEAQETYKVNAVFLMAVTIAESGAGTGWDLIDPSTYNWMSVAGQAKLGSYPGESYVSNRNWRKYASFEEATLDMAYWISEGSDYYFGAGKYSVDAIAPTYCDVRWGDSVNKHMSDLYSKAGINGNTASSSNANANAIQSLDNFLFIGDSRYEGIETQLEALGSNITAKGVGSSFPSSWIEPIKDGGGNVGRGLGDGVEQKDIGTLPTSVNGISVMLGVNGVTGSNQVSDMEELLNAIHSKYPNTPIFVNSVYHLNANYNGNAEKMNSGVDSFNEAMKEFCEANTWAHYIKVDNNLDDETGNVKTEYCSDGLHLNTAGQDILIDNIENAILDANVLGGKNNSSNTNNSNSKKINMTESITIDKNEEDEWCIVQYLNARIDNVYKTLDSVESDQLEVFEAQEEQIKKSLKLWTTAEYATKYLCLDSDPENYKYDPEKDYDYIQGIIKVKRYGLSEDGTEIDKGYLSYKDPNEFDELLDDYEENNNEDVFKYFTIDGQDNLVVAGCTEESRSLEWTGVQDPEDDGSVGDYKPRIARKVKLNYKSLVRPYTMPFNFLWIMTVYGEDYKLADDIAKLALESEIIIGVRDNTTVTTTTTIEKYLKEDKVEGAIKETLSVPNTQSDSATWDFFEYFILPSNTKVFNGHFEKEYTENADKNALEGINESTFYEKTITKVVTTTSATTKLELIDSWTAKYELTYEVEDPKNTGTAGEPKPIANTEYVMIEDLTEKFYGSIDDLKSTDTELGDFAGDLYKNISDGIKAAAGSSIYVNAATAGINNAMTSYGQPYITIFRDNNIASKIVNGNSVDFSGITQEDLDATYGAGTYNAETVKAECSNKFNDLNSRFGLSNKDNVINENIQLSELIVTTKKYRRTVNKTITTNVNILTRSFKANPATTTEKISKNPTDEEGENFVSTIYKKEHRKALQALTGSTSNWFFRSLESCDESQIGEMVGVDLVKYLLYCATNTDFGVTEFNFEDYVKKFQMSDSKMNGVGYIIGNTPEAKVWFALKSQGYDDIHIAAIMGNIYQESGFDNNAVNPSSGAYGLCQWLGGRKTGLEAYATSKGVESSDLQTQIEYLLAELTPGGGYDGKATYQLMNSVYVPQYTVEVWKNATTIEEATTAFCHTFERCDPNEANLPTRISAAQRYYDEYHGKILGGSEGELVILDDYYNTGIRGYYTNGGRTFTIYQQAVGPWSTYPYWSNNIGSDGCGPTSVAIILSGYGYTYTPDEMISTHNIDWCGDFDSMRVFLQEMLPNAEVEAKIGYQCDGYFSDDAREDMMNHLAKGGVILIWANNNSGNGSAYNLGDKVWTGHYLTLLGISEDGSEILVGDPGSYLTNKWYPADIAISVGIRGYIKVY